VWNSLPADRVDFSSFAAFKQTTEQIDFSQFLFGYEPMTTELVLAELLCCDCVFCNSLVFHVSAFLFYIVGSCKCRIFGLVVQLLF